MTLSVSDHTSVRGRPKAARVAAEQGGSRPTTRRGKTRGGRRSLFGMALIAPYLILLLLFGVGPIAYAIGSSLGLSSADGFLSPYLTALSDFRFLPAVVNVATFLAVYLPVMFFGVLILGLLIDNLSNRIGASFLLVYTLPGAVTGAASVLLWYFMLQPSLSPFAPALHAMGFETGNDIFRNEFLVVIFALMAFASGFGQWVLIVSGSLKSIPGELLDAARIDGCSTIQTALFVKLPMMSRTLLFMLILAFTGALQIFVEPQILSGLTGTGSKWWSLNQLGLTYAFSNGDFASAAALSMMLFVICLGLAVVVITKGKFMETEHQR